MKQETYSAKLNDGFIFTAIDNTSIAELIESAKLASKVVICNQTRTVVVHLESKTLYFVSPTEVTFQDVELKLLKPYTRIYGGKLSVGRINDDDISVKSHETVLYNYGQRAKLVK